MVARKPLPPAMIFFNYRGLTSLHAPTFTSHLNLRLLETPLETNSGYATEAYESPFTAHHCSLTVTPNKCCLRLKFFQNYSLHTCTTGLFDICRKKYLSICRNPLFIHNISLPNQYTSANSDFPAKSWWDG